jgi:hypothetical protein
MTGMRARRGAVTIGTAAFAWGGTVPENWGSAGSEGEGGGEGVGSAGLEGSGWKLVVKQSGISQTEVVVTK